jgi:hypothetical protein
MKYLIVQPDNMGADPCGPSTVVALVENFARVIPAGTTLWFNDCDEDLCIGDRVEQRSVGMQSCCVRKIQPSKETP